MPPFERENEVKCSVRTRVQKEINKVKSFDIFFFNLIRINVICIFH